MLATTRVDIVACAADGLPVAVVEVKNRENLSPGVARALRRNLVVHGLSVNSPYFLLISQDFGFLWERRVADAADAPPTLRFAMDRVVDRYLPGLAQGERLQGSALELLVLQWLSDLSEGLAEPTGEPERSLVGVGLLDAIRGTRISDAVAT